MEKSVSKKSKKCVLLDVQVFEVFRSGEGYIIEQEFPSSGACYIGTYHQFILQHFFFFFLILMKVIYKPVKCDGILCLGRHT